MQKYKVIEDVAVADIAYEVYGKNINELFENAATAIFEETVEIHTVEGTVEQQIEVNSDNLTNLLFDFLSEVLFVKDTEQFLGKEITVNIDEGNHSLKATMKGDTINYDKHELKNDIKAITLHMFSLEKTKEGYTAFIVVDI